jgi:flagellar basal body-associated protein FliL
MSEKKDKDKDGAPKKKKGGPVVLIGVAVGTLAIGGGAVYGLFAAGILGGPQVVIHEDNKPKLIRKGEEDPYAPRPRKAKGKAAAAARKSMARAAANIAPSTIRSPRISPRTCAIPTVSCRCRSRCPQGVTIA